MPLSIPGIYEEFQHRFAVAVPEIAGEHVHQCAAHMDAVFSGEDGQTLFGGVRPLVILAGEKFHCQHHIAAGQRLLRGVHRGSEKTVMRAFSYSSAVSPSTS